jgi:hypothetical protein
MENKQDGLKGRMNDFGFVVKKAGEKEVKKPKSLDSKKK